MSIEARDDSTVEEVEQSKWPEPATDATRLEKTVHRLRRKPLGRLSVEDLRVLLGQQVGLDVILERAFAHLEHDPYVSGDCYPGDLLVSVSRISVEYWRDHPDAARRARDLARRVRDVDDGDQSEHSPRIVSKALDDFESAVERFSAD